jgi:Acetyltransferase (GNAT) domain
MNYSLTTSPPDEATAAAWNDCLDNCEFAGLYTAPEFLQVPYLREQGPFAVLAISAGVVHGVATALRANQEMNCGLPGSPQICIRKGSNLEEVGQALAAGLKSHCLPSTKFIGAFAWNELTAFKSAGFRLKEFRSPLGTILLDLSKGADLLFRECAESRRYNVRRAIKAGVEVEEMDIDRDFDEYYALYRHWSEVKRCAHHPYDTQRAVFASRRNRLLLVARHKGKMIGVSTFRFRRPGIIEYTANVSRRDETKLRQNDLLMWRAIEWSIQQQDIRYLSMAGAHPFLERFGGRAQSTYRYSLDLTALRRRDLAELVHAVAVNVYHAIPERARLSLKKLLRGT